ncbi:MAG: hypothetical protein GYA55_03305 [SAR324 cluster bacterium]|uniref:Uncharacterized protein n=1 Tax=SAR324 cluster bacterium TaxID=2024889 RepID=A0A7X9IJL0_9DELT|nr:hypothetical protein [SAR324 cluster bacterium]
MATLFSSRSIGSALLAGAVLPSTAFSRTVERFFPGPAQGDTIGISQSPNGETLILVSNDGSLTNGSEGLVLVDRATRATKLIPAKNVRGRPVVTDDRKVAWIEENDDASFRVMLANGNEATPAAVVVQNNAGIVETGEDFSNQLAICRRHEGAGNAETTIYYNAKRGIYCSVWATTIPDNGGSPVSECISGTTTEGNCGGVASASDGSFLVYLQGRTSTDGAQLMFKEGNGAPHPLTPTTTAAQGEFYRYVTVSGDNKKIAFLTTLSPNGSPTADRSFNIGIIDVSNGTQNPGTLKILEVPGGAINGFDNFSTDISGRYVSVASYDLGGLMRADTTATGPSAFIPLDVAPYPNVVIEGATSAVLLPGGNGADFCTARTGTSNNYIQLEECRLDERRYGDMNNDGDITIEDALNALKVSGGLLPFLENTGWSIDVKFATEVLRLSVKSEW